MRADRLGKARLARCSRPAGTLALLGWLGVAAHAARACRAGRGRPGPRARPRPGRRPRGPALAAGARHSRPAWLRRSGSRCTSASQDANLLVPLYAVIGVAWLALALDALHGGRAGAAAAAAPRAAAAAAARVGERVAGLECERDRGRQGAGVLRAAVRRAAGRARRAPAAAAAAGRPAARPGGARARVRGDRRVPGARATTSGGTAS